MTDLFHAALNQTLDRRVPMTKSNTHTPGPWVADIGLRIRARGCVVGEVYEQPNDIDRANARLIAAAPELLAALRAMLAAGEFHYERTGWPSQFHAGALDAARAALAKIEG